MAIALYIHKIKIYFQQIVGSLFVMLPALAPYPVSGDSYTSLLFTLMGLGISVAIWTVKPRPFKIATNLVMSSLLVVFLYNSCKPTGFLHEYWLYPETLYSHLFALLLGILMLKCSLMNALK